MTANVHRETEVLDSPPRIEPAMDGVLPPGAAVGSWRITSPIAVGGCGSVYAARHHVLDRVAAVKVLHAALALAPAVVDRFVGEARAVNQIRHPNIVDIFDFGTLPDGRPFLVMELLAPDDLEQRVRAAGRLTLAEVLGIMTPVCLALEAAHRAGYVHRDLKARNIGFAVGAFGEVPKLLDFGIAKLLEDPERGATGTLGVGTPHCMSPEQICGERVDARTDVYALGVLLYNLLTGHYPFDGDPVEIERLHLDAPRPAPSRLAPVPPALDVLVARAMARTATARPASVREFLALLTAAVAAEPTRCAGAVAIRVALEVPAVFSDEDLDDAAAATEHATTLLGQAGFTPVLVTGTAVLAVLAVGDDPIHARARASAVADAIECALAGRPHARSGVALRIAVHAADAEIGVDTGAFIGGPLLDLHAWPGASERR